MSLNFGPLNNNISNQPVIKQSQKSQDGGAGNTGYFEQGQKEKDDDKDKDIFDKSIFDETAPDEDFLEEESDLAKKIMGVFKKLFGNK